MSLQGRSSEQRMTPLEELRDLCNNILTLRSNILVFLAGTLLHHGLSEPEFYGDLVYKFKKNVGRADFSDQFRKIIVRFKRIGYNINIMR